MSIATLQQKRELIQWFLDTCQLKEEKCRVLLKLLANNNFLLQRVIFVESIRFLPDAFLISAHGTKTVSYLYRLNNQNYQKTEEVITQLIANPPAKIYLWLSFDREKMNSLTANLLQAKEEVAFEAEMIKELAAIEKKVAIQYKNDRLYKKWLWKAIDEALIKKDQEAFQRLAARYKRKFG